MANEVKEKYGTITDLTLTSASLADGAGRCTAKVDNTSTRAGKVHVYVRVKSGSSAPTANALYKVYLLREDNHATEYTSEGIIISDSAVSTEPSNAQLVGAIVVTATANKDFYTDFMIHDPGPSWGLVLWNASGQTISSTETDTFIHYQTVTPEVQ